MSAISVHSEPLALSQSPRLPLEGANLDIVLKNFFNYNVLNFDQQTKEPRDTLEDQPRGLKYVHSHITQAVAAMDSCPC